MIISEGAGKTKMRASEFHFKVQKSWFGGDVTEKIEGWRTKIYEAAGKMVAVTINKVTAYPLQGLTNCKNLLAKWGTYVPWTFQSPQDEELHAPDLSTGIEHLLSCIADICHLGRTRSSLAIFKSLQQSLEANFDEACSAAVQKATVIPATDTFDDYLEMDIPEDAVTEEPVDPYSIDTSPGKPIKVG